MILRLKIEEFTLWRQTITLSSGFIGFSAALLGTNNLPSVPPILERQGIINRVKKAIESVINIFEW